MQEKCVYLSPNRADTESGACSKCFYNRGCDQPSTADELQRYSYRLPTRIVTTQPSLKRYNLLVNPSTEKPFNR